MLCKHYRLCDGDRRKSISGCQVIVVGSPEESIYNFNVPNLFILDYIYRKLFEYVKVQLFIE